jgi:hypothetical protein
MILDALEAGTVVELDEGERLRVAARADPALQQDGIARRGGVQGVFDQSAVDGLFRQRGEERRNLGHGVRFAGEHGDERARFGRLAAAGDGRLDKARPGGSERLLEPARIVRRDRGAVDEQPAAHGGEGGRAAAQHGVSGGAVGQHEEDYRAGGNHVGRAGGHASSSGGERRGLGGGAVPDLERVSGAQEPERQDLSHGAEAKETDWNHARRIVR